MKKIRITGNKKSELLSVSTPMAKRNWALVKIIVSPMCTEYKSWKNGDKCECLGHEAAGEVVDVSPDDEYLEVGDRVVVMPQYACGKCELCNKGDYIYCENDIDFMTFTGSDEGNETYAQYILKPTWLLPRIPDHISYELASMLCCGLGPTFGAMEQMGAGCFDTVLITGLGPVGLGGIINGKYRGSRVIGVSRNNYRNKLASDLKANMILDPDDPEINQKIIKYTNGRGVDMSIDCSGDERAQLLCIHSIRRRGQVAFVGESRNLTVEVSDQLIRKGLTLHGIWHYNYNDIPKLFQLVEAVPEMLNTLITHKFPLEEVDKAWKLQTSGQCGKVLLYPWGINN